ncbi:hypothetical protein PV371_27025 [Streptomyces sp. TX20-6-3]|uniref:hypothetical protein n=1 Tax=Streptomyces sp. TX20-6-3 TaxID=3028705 RepID=UPI0029ACC6E0|nr:hypothetical protein [Streptomyces sp. TX20-6-3]MDX2563288.1 hypothetical protein [Streptomyces sp. TX20-6-3]
MSVEMAVRLPPFPRTIWNTASLSRIGNRWRAPVGTSHTTIALPSADWSAALLPSGLHVASPGWAPSASSTRGSSVPYTVGAPRRV